MQNICVVVLSEKLCMGRSLDNEAILGPGGRGGGGVPKINIKKIKI
jgi:hypothetical protein